jgi:hypothetical protein
MMAPEPFLHRVADVARAQPHMFAVAHPKINVAHLARSRDNDPEVIKKGQPAAALSWHVFNKAQRHLSVSKVSLALG